MRRLQWTSSAPLLALLLSDPSHAATLVTPALTKSALERLDCVIANEGSKDIKVTFEAVSGSGKIMGGPTSLSLQPGSAVAAAEAIGFVSNVRCRFTGAFSKSLVRASINVRSSDGDQTLIIAPAQ